MSLERVRAEGTRFVLPDGSPWQWAFVDNYPGVYQILSGQGVPIPTFQWAKAIGANGVEAFLSKIDWANQPNQWRLVPKEWGATFWVGVEDYFKQTLAFELYVHVRLINDGRYTFTSLDEQRQFVQQYCQLAAAYPHVFTTFYNEPFKPDNVGAGNPFAFDDLLGPYVQAGLLFDRGAQGDDPGAYTPALQFSTYRHSRTRPYWYYKAGDAVYAQFGYAAASNPNFPGVRVPIVGDEPEGCDEVDNGGSRDSNPQHFRIFGRGLRAIQGGSFHFQLGTATGAAPPPGSIQDQSGRLFIASLRGVA